MRVEGSDLVDLRHAQAHFFGQSAQMSRGEVAVFVLNEVQMFDQQIAVARLGAQKVAHFGPCCIVELAALGVVAALALAGFPDALVRSVPFFIQRHCRTSLIFCCV